MSAETEAALERLRARKSTLRHALSDIYLNDDIATALAEIERQTNLADAERHRIERLSAMVDRLIDERVIWHGEIERLTGTLTELDAAITAMLRQPGAVGLEISPAIVGAVARHNQRTGATP